MKQGRSQPARRAIRREWPLWSYCLVLAVLNLVAYANSFNTGWHFDDGPNIIRNLEVQIQNLEWKTLGQAVSSSVGGKRPVAYLTFALNYYFFGLDARAYHVVNFIIHVANALLLFLLVSLILQKSIPARAPSLANQLSFFVAALWSTNPIQTQCVTYVVQRMNLLAALFSLLSFWSYVKGRSDLEVARKRFHFGLCFLFSLLAFGSKENTFLLPLVFLVYEWIFGEASRRRLKAALFAGSVLILLAGFAVWRYDLIRKIRVDYSNREFTMSERLLTQPRIICLHISQLLLPLPSRLALRHEVEKSTSLLLPATTLPSILLLTATAGAAVFWRKKYPFACFWMLWFFINLLIESSFLPLELIYEHRMYLPSAGLIATLVFLSFQYAPAHLGANESVAISKRLKVILGSLILCGVALTFARNKDWKDEVTLWADNARKYPESVRSWNNLGSAYIQTGQGEAAEASFRRAFEVDPTYPPARANLALICLNQGRVDEAVALIANFEETKIGTFSAEVYYDFGVVFEKKGILDKAIFHYRQAINRLPAHTEACFNLAIVYRRAGKYAEAREWFREFLRLWDGPVDSPYVAEAQRSLKELEKY